MRFITTITFLFISLVTFSQATQGTRITAPIVPNDSSDVYPTHDEVFGKGGFRSVKTISERDAIKSALRKEGMLVKVLDDNQTYTLQGGITNENWIVESVSDTTGEWVDRTIYISMPNDPQTPGSDLTGDGSSIKPFATITKALNNIKSNVYASITLKLDSGNFNLTKRDVYELNNRIKRSFGNLYTGLIEFKGTFYKENYTYTLANTSIPYVFKISGITVNKNQLMGLFFGSSTNPDQLIPVGANFNDTIINSGVKNVSSSSSALYSLVTVLTGDAVTPLYTFNETVNFKHIKFNMTNVLSSYMQKIRADYCYFDFGNSFRSANNQFYGCLFAGTSSNLTQTGFSSEDNSLIDFSAIYKKGADKIGGGIRLTTGSKMSQSVINGFECGLAVEGYYPAKYYSTVSFTFLFVDCKYCFGNPQNPNNNYYITVDKLTTLHTDYLLKTFGNYVNGIVSINTTSGNPLKAIFDPASTYKAINDPSNGWLVKFPGLSDNKSYFDDTETAVPLVTFDFSTDKVSINKDKSALLTSTLNVGGGVDASFYRTETDTMETKAIVRGKQDRLVSGTNIKTVNGETILGSGDISISSGSYSFSNGLTGNENSVKLGGTLSENTTIDLNDNFFYLNNPNSTIHPSYYYFSPSGFELRSIINTNIKNGGISCSESFGNASILSYTNDGDCQSYINIQPLNISSVVTGKLGYHNSSLFQDSAGLRILNADTSLWGDNNVVTNKWVKDRLTASGTGLKRIETVDTSLVSASNSIATSLQINSFTKSSEFKIFIKKVTNPSNFNNISIFADGSKIISGAVGNSESECYTISVKKADGYILVSLSSNGTLTIDSGFRTYKTIPLSTASLTFQINGDGGTDFKYLGFTNDYQ